MDRLLDPIPELTGLMVLESDPGFPVKIRPVLRQLNERIRSIKYNDTTGWLALYKDALDAAQKALMLDSMGCGPAGPSRPATRDDERLLNNLIMEIERSDRESISYVTNERLPRQRDGEIKELLGKLSESIEIFIQQSGGQLAADFKPEDRKELVGKLSGVLSGWHLQALQGAVARITRNREPVLEHAGGVLKTLCIETPPLPVVPEEARPSRPDLPAARKGELMSFGTALWRTFRSSTGFLFMLSMAAVPLIGYFGSKVDPKFWIFTAGMPLLFAISAWLAAKDMNNEKGRLFERLASELKRELATALAAAADNERKEIQGALRKLQSEHDNQLKIWRFKAGNRLAEALQSGTSTSSATGGMDRLVREKIEGRYIPSLRRRIEELKTASVPGT
jgi:hypothetical protein